MMGEIELPTWKNTLNTDLHSYGNFLTAVKMAVATEYPNLLWHGRIYKLIKTQLPDLRFDYTPQDTGFIETDLDTSIENY